MATIVPTQLHYGAASSDNQLPQDLITQMQRMFNKPNWPGYRTTHAKGILVEGEFTPTEEAKTLSIAPHFNNATTKVIARFSVGGGIPVIQDANDAATPKGVAIRFQVDDDVYTDLIAHSFNGFATRTGEDFLTFLHLVETLGIAGKAFQANPSDPKLKADFDQVKAAMGAFQQKVPAAGVFFNSPKPNPHNYGTLTYYQPNTHVLTNSDGTITNVRYRIDPADGNQLYTPEEVKGLGPNYLQDDLSKRFPEKPIVFTIQAHIAGESDILDDATKPYTSETFIPVGKLEINKVAEDQAEKQQMIAFSPTPTRGGIDGIDVSGDPLIQTRKGVYYISADQRRHERRKSAPGAVN